MRTLALTLLPLLTAACDSGPERRPRTAEEKATLQAAIDRVVAEAGARDERLHAAAWAAQDTLQLGTTPCPIPTEALWGDAADPRSRYLALLRRSWRIDARTFPGMGPATVDVSTLKRTDLTGTILPDREDPVQRKLDAYALPDPEHLLFLLVRDEVKAERQDQERFAAGALTGDAWLWSKADGRVVCGAPFGAISSEEVRTTVFAHEGAEDRARMQQVSLNADVVANAAASALSGLRTAVPREP